MFIHNLVHEHFQLFFIDRDYLVTSQTRKVVVMLDELVAQLDLVLPTDIQSVHNADFFECFYRAIHAGPVNLS